MGDIYFKTNFKRWQRVSVWVGGHHSESQLSRGSSFWVTVKFCWEFAIFRGEFAVFLVGIGGSMGRAQGHSLGPKSFVFGVFSENWPNNRLAPPPQPLGNPGSASGGDLTFFIILHICNKKNPCKFATNNCTFTLKMANSLNLTMTRNDNPDSNSDKHIVRLRSIHIMRLRFSFIFSPKSCTNPSTTNAFFSRRRTVWTGLYTFSNAVLKVKMI